MNILLGRVAPVIISSSVSVACDLQATVSTNLQCIIMLHVCAHNYNRFTLATVIVILVHFLLSECLICTCNNIILLVLPCSGLLYHGAEFSGLALHSGTTLRTTSNGETILYSV